MNEISIINDFTIDLFNQNELVNTITIVPTNEVDNNKENIYPLVNIDLIDTNIEEQAIFVNYTITVVQQRDIKPKLLDTKLMSDTNYLDNLNETHSIAERFINQLTKQHNDSYIEVIEYTNLKALKNWRSGLDGFQFNITLATHNIGASC